MKIPWVNRIVNLHGLEVSRYIHMNPVEAGLIERPELYPRSSMGVYTRKKNTPMRLREIGEVLGGIGIHAVCKKVSRFEKEARGRKDYGAAIRELEKALNV